MTEVLLRSSLREALSTLEVHSSRTLDATLSEDTFVDFHKQVLEVMAGENTAESKGVESLRPSLESLLARLSTEGAVSLPLLHSMMQLGSPQSSPWALASEATRHRPIWIDSQ